MNVTGIIRDAHTSGGYFASQELIALMTSNNCKSFSQEKIDLLVSNYNVDPRRSGWFHRFHRLHGQIISREDLFRLLYPRPKERRFSIKQITLGLGIESPAKNRVRVCNATDEELVDELETRGYEVNLNLRTLASA